MAMFIATPPGTRVIRPGTSEPARIAARERPITSQRTEPMQIMRSVRVIARLMRGFPAVRKRAGGATTGAVNFHRASFRAGAGRGIGRRRWPGPALHQYNSGPLRDLAASDCTSSPLSGSRGRTPERCGACKPEAGRLHRAHFTGGVGPFGGDIPAGPPVGPDQVRADAPPRTETGKGHMQHGTA